ncbi:HEWD family protein [Halapricum desulfuricans]|uniref:Zn finger domain containing protein n=1 Tax=Halapricum desulfuricans TaxID=2841257 RepID=A0A897NW70_9EURY|nr:HEWD family protein [Halapricum desulfuricans]QSG14909.1 Zn finger domain containing protein [Halapricum desulfuricans]
MATIVPPTRRECERCGRVDVWDDEQMNWTISGEDDEKRVGNPQCLHEWDINGEYNPFDPDE